MGDVTSDHLLLLRADDISGLISVEEAIESQRSAFGALASGQGVSGPRALLPGSEESTAFCYAARLSPHSDPVSKFGSVVPANPSRGLPAVSALVVVLDAQTGRPAALIEGEAVTNLRTAAASTLAAQLLTKDARRIAVIGWGRQGRLHAEMLSAVLAPESICVFAPHAEEGDLVGMTANCPLTLAASTEDAVRGADLVVTCTTSRVPVLELDWLASDATVLSIGSFAPGHREVGRDVISDARVVVDHRATALLQAGPVVEAVDAGALDPDSLVEIGDLLDGRLSISPDAFVYYNSVGVGIQDAAIAELILERAHRQGAGTSIPW